MEAPFSQFDESLGSFSHLPLSDELINWTVRIWDGPAPPRAPWEWSETNLKNRRVCLDSSDYEAFYHSDPPIFYWLDRPRRQIYGWLPRNLPYWEKAIPLLHPLESILGECGVDVVHAGAVALEGRGLLLVGKGGSGKSTTTTLAAQNGWDFLGDDFCGAESGRIWSLFCSAKVHPERLSWLPGLAGCCKSAQPGDEKVLLHLGGQVATPSQVRMAAVVLPKVMQRSRSRLAPASAAQALLAIAPSSLSIVPGRESERLARISRWLRITPCWHLELGQDPESIPDLLKSLL